MLFVVHALDRPETGLREAHYAAHRAYLDAAADIVIAGGPPLDDAGDRVLGSLLIIDCQDRAAADQFMAAEPFNGAGLFAEVQISRWARRRWSDADAAPR